MAALLKQPIFLLLATGTLLGLNFPLSAKALQAQISPSVWALVLSIGVCVILLPKLLLKNELSFPTGRTLRYVILSAIISYILPNILIIGLMTKLGAGFMGLMFALSPVFTLLFATLAKLDRPVRLTQLGITLGLVGASIVSFTKHQQGHEALLIWIIAALAVPFCLGLGNIYRTLDWPKDAKPDGLAFWGHCISSLFFLIISLWLYGEATFSPLIYAPDITLAQIIVSGLTFPLFFRLQKVGGPVLLSQIGYVAAAVSLFSATIFLGETYPTFTWIGAGIIGLGILFTIQAQRLKLST